MSESVPSNISALSPTGGKAEEGPGWRKFRSVMSKCVPSSISALSPTGYKAEEGPGAGGSLGSVITKETCK